jgi:hypothetical protein
MDRRALTAVAALAAVTLAGGAWLLSRDQGGGSGAFTTPIEAPPAPEVLAPQQGGVTVRMTRVGGAPITDCMATLWELWDDGSRIVREDSNASCGPDGALRWDGVAAGRYRVMIQSEGAEFVDRVIAVPEQGLDLGTLELGGGGEIAGIALLDGEPVTPAQVRVLQTGQTEDLRPDGSFRLSGVPVGTVDLLVGATGRLQARGTVEVELRGQHTVELALAPMPPKGAIGVRFEVQPSGLLVTEIAPSGPAAGVLVVGDVIESVEGRPVQDVSKELARELLAGPPGSVCALTLRGKDAVELERVPVESLGD